MMRKIISNRRDTTTPPPPPRVPPPPPSPQISMGQGLDWLLTLAAMLLLILRGYWHVGKSKAKVDETNCLHVSSAYFAAEEGKELLALEL